MKIVWLLWVLIFAVLVFGFGYWQYENREVEVFGEKMQSQIREEGLTPEEKAVIEVELGGSEDERYAGSLDKVTDNKVKVWGKAGTKGYDLDSNSILFFYSICDKLRENRVEENLKPIRDIYTMDKFSEWEARVSEDDYVVVLVASGKKGRVKGHAAEVRVYDWWPMIPVSLNNVCLD